MITVRNLITRLQSLPADQQDLPVAVYDVDSGNILVDIKPPYHLPAGEDGQGESHPDCICIQACA